MTNQCEFNDSGVCQVCGVALNPRFDPHNTFRACKAKTQPPSTPSPGKGLGSALARILHCLGFRQKPGCGCHYRELWLNEFGQKIYFTCIRLWNAIFPFWRIELPPVRLVKPLNPNQPLTAEQLAKKVEAVKKMLAEQNKSL